MWLCKNASSISQFLRIVYSELRVLRRCSTKSDGKNTRVDSSLPDLPEPPTTCCMSACANCVWIEYANKLNDIFRDGGGKSLEIIEENITDPNMKAFLIMEVKIACRKK